MAVRSIDDLRTVKRLLNQYELRARKALGQNFLVDREVLDKILIAADLCPEDLVVEVGPGLGILTEELTRSAHRVVAVELDDKLCSLLRKELSHYSNLTIVSANILDIGTAELLQLSAHSEEAFPDYKVVANLPYYVAASVIRHFLEAPRKPTKMVIMIQKEVGQTIVAESGKRAFLSLTVQVYGKPTISAVAPAGSFYPVPKVDSVVVTIDVYEEPLVSDVGGFFEVARAGFSAPRKQLHNALSRGLGIPINKAKEMLQEAGIDSQRRPGALSIGEWETLCEVWRREAQSS